MSDVPFLKRASVHKIGKAGRKSEKRLAKDLGGRLTPASGAMEGAKGDIVLKDVLVEAKSTTGKSLGVKFEWLAKISEEARSVGKTPALTISFVTEDGRAVIDGDWALIPMWQFKELQP